jgi:hypothetical protein
MSGAIRTQSLYARGVPKVQENERHERGQDGLPVMILNRAPRPVSGPPGIL